MHRPGSSAGGARGSSRRQAAVAAPPVDPVAEPAGDADEPDEPEGEKATWKVELESIASGTHPALIEALEPHTKKLEALVAQADRVRQLQIGNINALFECEKKQTEDENKAQLEFFKSRLIDTIEEKRKKAARTGDSSRASGSEAKAGADKGRKRPLETPGCLPASFCLKAEELKSDLEEINTNVDHYSVRSAAVASDELRSGSTSEAWFDRQRQLLHVNGLQLERGQSVFVYMQGQRVDDVWQLHAMNAVEATLRDSEGTKLKVTLAQLRNGRYSFRPAHM